MIPETVRYLDGRTKIWCFSLRALPGLCQSDDAVSILPDTYGLAVTQNPQ
jgi:hypothetical protein